MRMNRCFVVGLMAFGLANSGCGVFKKKDKDDDKTEQVKEDESIENKIEEVVIKKGHENEEAVKKADGTKTDGTKTDGTKTDDTKADGTNIDDAKTEPVVVIEEKLDAKYGDIKEFSLDLITDSSSSDTKTFLVSIQDVEENLQHFGGQFKASEIASSITNIKDSIYGYELEANIKCVGADELRPCDVLAAESKTLDTNSSAFDQSGAVLSRINDTSKYEVIAAFSLTVKSKDDASAAEAVINNLENLYNTYLIKQEPVVPVVLDECGLEASEQSGIKVCYFTLSSAESNTEKSIVLKNYNSEKTSLGIDVKKEGDNREVYLGGNLSIEANSLYTVNNLEFSLAADDTVKIVSSRVTVDSCVGSKVENGKVQCAER